MSLISGQILKGIWHSWGHFWSILHGFLELWMHSQRAFKEEIIQEPDWTIGADAGLRMKGILVVPNIPQLKKELFDEAHRAKYTIHLGTTKMYKDLKRHFCWKNMRKDMVEYVANCYTCQQVKAEYKRPAGTLQRLPISKWSGRKF